MEEHYVLILDLKGELLKYELNKIFSESSVFEVTYSDNYMFKFLIHTMDYDDEGNRISPNRQIVKEEVS